jgi:Flp pilus assembly protein TadD
VLFVYSAVQELRGNSLSVLPVSVPESLSKFGYTSVATSQRIAHQMASVVRSGDAEGSSEISSDEASRVQRQIVGSQEVPDIQMPGQEFSFKTVSRFVKNAWGLNSPALSISISEDREQYIAEILVLGGPYGGSRESVRGQKTGSIDDLMSSIAIRAVRAAQPLSYAAYLIDARPETCAVTANCFDEAISVLSRLLVNEYLADDASAHLGLSAVSLRQGDSDEAMRHCEAARSIDPSLGWSYIYCAYALNGQKKRDEAIKYAMIAAAASSDDPNLHAGLGDVLMRLGRLPESEKQYKQAVRLSPRNPYSFIGLGTVARIQGRPKEAVEYYRAALLLNPVEPYAHGGLGAALVALGANNEAIPHLQTALRLDPTYAVASDALKKALENLPHDAR